MFADTLEAMPVLAAVVRVGEVAVAELVAVRNVPAVCSCRWCCAGRCRADRVVVARSAPAVDVFPVGAPGLDLVVHLRESVRQVGLALLVSHRTFHAAVVVRAGLRESIIILKDIRFEMSKNEKS